MARPLAGGLIRPTCALLRRPENLFLILVAALGAALFAAGIAHADPRSLATWGPLLLVAAPLALAAFALFVLTRARAARITASLTLAAAIAGAYAAEAWVVHERTEAQRRAAEARSGPRGSGMLAKILELRAAGIKAYPAVYPAHVALNLVPEYGDLLAIDGEPLITLGGVPDAVTVFCPGAGGWVVYDSDEYGFNNPRGLWSRPVEIAAVGDSFTHGACVPPAQNLLGHIRARVPGTLNLGQGGNGPVIELAGIREYVAMVRPRVVLWVFYDGNDIDNLLTERMVPGVRRYLEPGYRRDLPARNAEIARILKDLTEREIARASAPRAAPVTAAAREVAQRQWTLLSIPGLSHETERMLLLANVREALGLTFGRAQWRGTVEFLQSVLAQAKGEVEAWGGALHFVYLPSYETAGYRHARRIGFHDDVVAGARAAGLPVIDLYPVFAAAPDLARLYDPVSGHYSPEGYALAGEAVLQALGK